MKRRISQVGEFYTVQGAADALGIRYQACWKRIFRRQVPTYLMGRTVLVKLADLKR